MARKSRKEVKLVEPAAKLFVANASRWGQFVMWAKRFYEEPNFDADERD